MALAGSVCAQVGTSPQSRAVSPSADERPDEPALAGAVEELLPPLYYLEDAQGVLRPAPGFTLEDFRRAYDCIHGLAFDSEFPPYVLKKITITGQTEERYAKLTIHCDVLLAREAATRIPLAFGQAVLVGEAQQSGYGPLVLAFDEHSGGYVAWVKGKPNQPCRLTLKVLAPLTTAGGNTSLRLSVPSATESELSLEVPLAHAVAEASEGALLETAPSDDKKGTRLTVGGLRGDFELTWHKPEIRAASEPTVLEAVGEILARIDNQGIHSQATLVVRGHGKPFDRFRIRLPAVAELVPASDSSYTIVELPEASDAGGRIVEARLPEKTLGPVHVRVAASRMLDTSLFGQWIELSGFGVLGAARQSGHLAVEVAEDLDLLWNPRLGVQQCEDLPDSLVRDDLAAGFQYFTQPCSLVARIAPRQTRMSVEPRYVVVVDEDRAQLDATLAYTIRGKKARVLDVDFGPWRYDEIGPENVVAADRVVQDASGRLSIPLLQPSSGKIELTIKAHQSLAASEGALRLTFPRPEATTSTPAVVVIAPEDRVQLTVDSKATRGLTRQQIAPHIPLPERQQPPLVYRGDPAKALFVAEHHVHTQRVAVSSTTRVLLDRDTPAVTQRFSYRIDYEPLDALMLEIPRALTGETKLEFRVAGERLPLANVLPGRSGGASMDGGPARVRLRLPAPRIGECDLEVRYPLAPCELVPRSCIRSVVPLVVPLDGELTSNRLLVAAAPELRVSAAEGPWTSEKVAPGSAAASDETPPAEFVADGRFGEAELQVSLQTRDTPRAMVVQRALLQTWLTRRGRQDRAIFRFTTREPSLVVVLPQGTVMSSTAVFLDEKAVEARSVGPTSLAIDLSDAGALRQRILEVHSRSSATELLRGRCSLELPRLAPAAWMQRVYWQLTLPNNEHVVYVSSGMTREFRWGWNGLFWGRQPLLATADLERWMGAPEDPRLAAGSNSDLFSSFGRLDSLELVIVSRSWIVLAASGGALVLGVLLIYVPASRHPACLLVLAIGLGFAAMVEPELTVLLAQAASLGLALTFLTGLLERGVARRRRDLVTLETPGSRIERDSTQTQIPAAFVAAASSTDALLPKEPSSDKASPIGP